jgi:hypothetical protein
MKKYAIYILIVIAVISASLMAFTPVDKESSKGGNDYILVEIYEVPSYKDKGVHIHYGNGKRELVPFKEFTAENHDDNGDIILNCINKLVADGYVIESSAAGVADAGMITKVFMRKK